MQIAFCTSISSQKGAEQAGEITAILSKNCNCMLRPRKKQVRSNKDASEGRDEDRIAERN